MTTNVLTGAENRFVGVVQNGVKVPYFDEFLVVDAEEPPIQENFNGVYGACTNVVVGSRVERAGLTMSRDEVMRARGQPGATNVTESADNASELSG